MGENSYANAWLALLPQAHLPSVAAQAVARECAKFADWGTGQNVRPGRKRLAWNLNTSQDTVKVAMRVCIAHGVLKVVAKGGVKGPKTQAAVYCLSVPEHLATPENLATFPDSANVVIVRPKIVSQPKYPANNPDDEPSVGSGLPAEDRCSWSPSGERVPHAGGSGLPDQWGTGSPPPSMDPPSDPPGFPPPPPPGAPSTRRPCHPRPTPPGRPPLTRTGPSSSGSTRTGFELCGPLYGKAFSRREDHECQQPSSDWGTTGGRTPVDLHKQGAKRMPSPLFHSGTWIGLSERRLRIGRP